jgi:succinate dehydrogenase/fumarate reductase flavoprotein subunit
MTHFAPEDVKKMRVVLPIPTMILERAGVLVEDRIEKKVEWAPTFFGTIGLSGGVIANTKCETSLPGLYVCGDAMGYPPAGPAALAGAAVTGARAGTFATEYAKGAKEVKTDEEQVENLRIFTYAPIERHDGIDPDHVIIGIQEILNPYEITVISRGDRMEKAIKEIERMRDEEVPLLYASDAHYLRLANEIKSMVLLAEMYLRSRLLRTESREGCLREDYPYTDNVSWLKNTRLKQEQGRMKLWTEDIPVDKYRIRPSGIKYLNPVFEVATKKGIKWG